MVRRDLTGVSILHLWFSLVQQRTLRADVFLGFVHWECLASTLSQYALGNSRHPVEGSNPLSLG